MPPSKQHTNYHKILKLISKMRTNIYLRIKPQWSAQYQCLFFCLFTGCYCLQLYNQLLHHLRITMYLLLTNKSSSHPQGYRNKIKKAF